MKQKIHYLFMLLLMIIGGAGGAKADEVIFDAEVDKDVSSVTKDKVRISMSVMNNGTDYRCYKSSDMTIYGLENEGITITKISFTCTAKGTNKYGPGCFSLKNNTPGSYSYSEDTGTWEGETTGKIVLTASSNQVRMTKIVVTYTKGSVDPNAPGTENNPYTVAQALENTPESGNSAEVCVKGIVSGFYGTNTNILSDYSHRYYISDEGTETDQLLVYNGKGLNNVTFSSAEDVQVGDIVVIKGQLTTYQGTKEFAKDNYIVSLTRKEKVDAELAFTPTEVTAVRGDAFTAPTLTNNYNVPVVYTSSNKSVATVAEDGTVTLLKAGTTTITAAFVGNNDYKAGEASYTLTVTVPSHAATFFVNGQQQGEPATVAEDETITFPTVVEELYGKQFVGWTTEAIDGETNDEPATLVNAATMGNTAVTYYAVFANVTAGTATNTVDELTLTTTGVTGTSYSGWSDKKATSDADAVYAGQSAGGNESIQLRSKNSNSGVISTTSGGRLKKVVVVWNDATDEGRTLNVYGSNTAYTAATELYGDDAVGSLLGTIVKGTSTELEIDGDYAYVGLRSKDGAMYLTSISITWENGTPDTYSDYCTTVVKPVAKIGNKGFETLQAAVDAAEEDATIDIVDDFTLTTVTTSPSNKYNVNIGKSVVINGNNHVITSAEGKRAIVLEGEGLNVTLKDLTIKSNKAEACLWIASNLTCTLDNTVLDGTNGKTYNQPLTIGSVSEEGRVKLNVTNGSVIKTNDAGTAHYAIIAWHPADITVTDSKLIGWANVYLKPAAAGSTVKIDGSEMKSQGLSGNSNNFSTITTECGNNVIEVKDTKITSAAVDGTYMSLLTLGGEGNVVKLLGETTYETNSKEWGAITFNWGSLFKNKLYLDDTTKEALAEYFDGSHQETVDPADETGLYPVSFVPEVYYYWAVESGYQGGYYNFAEPFENGWLADGEFIALQKDITLTKNIACQLGEGTSFNFLLGDYNVTKGDYSVSLNTGVTVLTDKQTDIFKAAKAGYKIVESTTEEGYSYTAQLSAPIIFHDEGTYEDALTVAIAGEGTIKYTLNGGAEKTYTEPITIDATTTITAWTEQDGATSDEVSKTFTINKTENPAINLNGYYSIKNNGNDMYVNVAGRKTVTFVDKAATATAAGTVIKVETENAQVKVLRSQGVDVPGYADKAMRYVPKIVQLVVDKLNAEGTGTILGENGLKKIMEKFDASFDEHLYLEEAENGYRIYGRTPSMKPVVDFYAENKANVDAKLPQLEDFINSAIQKVLEKTKGRGKSILVPFSLKTVWENMGKTLTEPVDEASTMKFYEEVLTSETNVWNFAYETAMIYWTKVEQLINNPDPDSEYADMLENLGDYKKYLEKVPNIRPNFKYFIVQKDNKLDIISEGNGELNADFTAWTLEPRTDFSVAFNEENVLNDKYYTTLYTDFAYTLPTGVKAYKVTEVSKAAVAKKVEMEGTIPAQTPVLLESESKENQKLILSTEDGTAPADNILVGADALINQYQIKTAQVEGLFNLAKIILGESFYNTYIQKYEHLMARNAGTVNNKYFFGLTAEDIELCTYKNKEGEDECVIRNLGTGENQPLAFYGDWQAPKANQAFLVSETFNSILLMLKGDVNRSGDVTVADVNALVEIVLGKVTEPDDTHDFDAAHVNADKDITIADVTALVNIILGKTQN